jgi:hypothetical protein
MGLEFEFRLQGCKAGALLLESPLQYFFLFIFKMRVSETIAYAGLEPRSFQSQFPK